MKGLIKKDFILIGQQKITMIVLIVIVFLISMVNDEENLSLRYSILCGYLMMLGAMISLSTISYDESDNGYPYLMTMPFTRKMYVSGKFIVCGIMSIIAAAIAGAIVLLSSGIVDGHLPLISDMVMIMAAIAAGSVVVSGIGIPSYLKFGQQKGIIGIIVVFVLIYGGVYIINKIVQSFGISFKSLLSGLSNLEGSMFAILLIAVAAIIFIISWSISVRIMEKKEF